MRKQAIHVKDYTRSRHGRAKFGGKVSAHDKDVKVAAPPDKGTATIKMKKGSMPELSVYCVKCRKKYKSTDYKIVTMPSGMRRAVPTHTCGTKGSVFLGMKKTAEKSGRAEFVHHHDPLTEGELRDIAQEEGLDKKNADRFVSFMKMRLPNERHSPYAAEWAHRFDTGGEYFHSDNESLATLKKIDNLSLKNPYVTPRGAYDHQHAIVETKRDAQTLAKKIEKDGKQIIHVGDFGGFSTVEFMPKRK